jgi:hypothetical protein
MAAPAPALGPEPRAYYLTATAAAAARADLTRQGFACQLVPAWALVAVGPVPGAPAPEVPPALVDVEDLAEVPPAPEPDPEPEPGPAVRPRLSVV